MHRARRTSKERYAHNYYCHGGNATAKQEEAAEQTVPLGLEPFTHGHHPLSAGDTGGSLTKKREGAPSPTPNASGEAYGRLRGAGRSGVRAPYGPLRKCRCAAPGTQLKGTRGGTQSNPGGCSRLALQPAVLESLGSGWPPLSRGAQNRVEQARGSLWHP